MRLPNSLAECLAAKSPTSPCRSRSGRRWWPAPRREGRRVTTRGRSIRRPIGLRAGRAASSWCSTCGRSPSTIPTEYSPEPTNSLKRSEGSRRLQSRLLSPSIAAPLCDVIGCDAARTQPRAAVVGAGGRNRTGYAALTPRAGPLRPIRQNQRVRKPDELEKGRLGELGTFARDKHGPGYRTCSRGRPDNKAQQVFGYRNRHAI